jgi:putative transposase
MRYPASEKIEIIRIVEQSSLSARRTLGQIGMPRATFYRWYDLYQTGGPEALEDLPARPSRVWNRIPDDVRAMIVELALEQSELSPRELAVRFTDENGYFVSEATVDRLLKAHDLITSPAFIVIRSASEFTDKTVRPNEMWQTDFTYLKIIGWGWMYLSTILDDFSRYIIASKLCTTMKAEDVTDTLEMALAASGCDQAHVRHSRAYSATMGLATSPAILPNGSISSAWPMCAERPIIPRPRARSSAGTRPSRTASCSKTTTCPATSKLRSSGSSTTTITTGITRASTT